MNTRKILYPVKYCISFFFLYLFLYFADYFEPVISQRLIDSVGNIEVVGRLILYMGSAFYCEARTAGCTEYNGEQL